jgi:putative pyruvate formate lyase activating enzyme
VTGCGLGCNFCQNYQISQDGLGKAASSADFATLTLALQNAGAENINIVTGGHAAPAIAAGLDLAREQGLHIPVLWNSSAYEGKAALDLLRGRVDVYLPDLKTLDPPTARLFFRAPDYPQYAAAAITRMLDAQGTLRWKNGAGGGDDSAAPLLAGGVIIRHLIIPGYLESTREVIAWFSRHARGRALLSLMTQYTPPAGERGGKPPGPDPAGYTQGRGGSAPQRRLIREEYNRVMDWLGEWGVEDGFYQELAAAPRGGGRDWFPDFNQINPFSSRFSQPVWHWKSPFPRL